MLGYHSYTLNSEIAFKRFFRLKNIPENDIDGNILKRLYGLQQGELGKSQAQEGQKGFQPVNRSTEQLVKLSQDEIAKEMRKSIVLLNVYILPVLSI